MFTGLIKGLGEVVARINTSRESRFTFKPLFVAREWENGESIAVNGVCLSVEAHGSNNFQVYASAETLSVTTLASLQVGNRVNLEPALAFGEKLGGHLVSGHVDCIAEIIKIIPAGESRQIFLGFPREYASEIVKKGSVALDGVSLTINECGNDFLSVNIIPDSLAKTNISSWKIGTRVNMETDMIGKYVARNLDLRKSQKNSQLNKEFLFANGYL